MEKGRQMEGEVRGAVTEGYQRHGADMADHNPTQWTTSQYPAYLSLFPVRTHAGAHRKTVARPVGAQWIAHQLPQYSGRLARFTPTLGRCLRLWPLYRFITGGRR